MEKAVIVDDGSIDKLNALLSDGWTVKMISGTGITGDHWADGLFLVIVEK